MHYMSFDPSEMLQKGMKKSHNARASSVMEDTHRDMIEG